MAVTTVMLLLDRPARLMVGYLVGAYVTSITLGLVIVFSFSSSSAVNTTQNTVSPAVDIGLGTVALAIAFVLHSGRDERVLERRRARKEAKGKKEPRWRRRLSQGSPLGAFVVGTLLTLPGASYLAGLHAIHKLDYPSATTVLLVVGFNLVMLWLLEVPLACYLLAPNWTPGAVERAKAWAARHARTYAVRGFAAVGALLVLKGAVGLIS